jgi:hypothetical protein
MREYGDNSGNKEFEIVNCVRAQGAGRLLQNTTGACEKYGLPIFHRRR